MISAILSGLFSGIVSGMGIGGGTILIPALTMFLGLDQRTAQGVNLLYFLPTAAVALIVHKKNKVLDIKTAVPVMLFGAAGAILGAFCALRLHAAILKRLFGGFLFFMGAYEIYKGYKAKK